MKVFPTASLPTEYTVKTISTSCINAITALTPNLIFLKRIAI